MDFSLASCPNPPTLAVGVRNQPKKLTNPPILAVGVLKQTNPIDTSLVPRGPSPPAREGWRAGGGKPPTRQHSRPNVISLGALPRGPGVTRGAGNAGGAWEGPREGGKGPPPGRVALGTTEGCSSHPRPPLGSRQTGEFGRAGQEGFCRKSEKLFCTQHTGGQGVAHGIFAPGWAEIPPPLCHHNLGWTAHATC